MATVLELAWAAGILDGEGCISIVRFNPPKGSPLASPRHVLHVKVTMGHRPTVERLLAILGVGSIQHHVSRSSRVNASYSYIVQSRLADGVLQTLRPFLITKAEEADLALAFAALPLGPRGGGGGGAPLPLAILEVRDRYHWELRKLKPRWRFYAAKMRKEGIPFPE